MSDDERAQRLAELKRKMQESAKAKKAQQSATETVSKPAVEKVKDTSSAEVTASAAPATETPAAVVVETAKPAAASVAAAEPSPVTASAFKGGREPTPDDRAKSQMNRREFLTYAWGAALGLAVLQTAAVSFFFMYPRFKAGEFGGAFFMGPETAVPPTDAPPQNEPDGKFWWVNVEEEGPHAIYVVCTHLGCLYKWVDENYRFECPCHGSKFTREGFYIEGPAPRSLDQFEVTLVDGTYVVDTGAKTLGSPADESPFKGTG